MQGPIKLQTVAAAESGKETDCDVMHAVRDALAILSAIEEGGLLDALPEMENDRHRHQTGRTMLELLATRLRQAMATPIGAWSDGCRCNGK